MKSKAPVTAAVRALRAAGVDYSEHLYDYEERGGTRHSAQALGVPEHQVIKTLIFQDGRGQPLCVLMHGDRKVSQRELGRLRGDKAVAPCDPAVAERHSGYQVGGTSPFGLRRPMPILVERSVLGLERIWLNGGKRGFLVGLAPAALVAVLGAEPVDVAAAAEAS